MGKLLSYINFNSVLFLEFLFPHIENEKNKHYFFIFFLRNNTSSCLFHRSINNVSRKKPHITQKSLLIFLSLLVSSIIILFSIIGEMEARHSRAESLRLAIDPTNKPFHGSQKLWCLCFYEKEEVKGNFKIKIFASCHWQS